ncbi:hypothetical protein [Desmospora profundinema]|uniref:Lycopene cyclase domain-containing protein n=1 Tax=Desmospora profundinema TaxID=1571184 RepID=A0ABU1IMJ6_9BACL|nr:hypothetical protein [Desmospora profundinema]MDR6226003.1 hypothetical protein [Desmospora profundinema]
MKTSSKHVNRVALYSVLLMILTAVHHYYASIIYQSPWRLHVVQVSVVVIIYTLVTLIVLRKWPNTLFAKILLSIFFVVTFVVSVAWIGLFEGGYNHVVKNIVYLIGVPESVTSAMFPPSIYHAPHDLFYEGSGVAQFVFPYLILLHFYRFYQQRKEKQEN